MNEAVSTLFDSVTVSVDSVGFAIALNLAFIAAFGLVAAKTTVRVITWVGQRFGGYVKLYDVVTIGNGKQYKLVKIRFHGVVLENGDGGNILLIPLGTWSTMQKTVIKQLPVALKKQ